MKRKKTTKTSLQSSSLSWGFLFPPKVSYKFSNTFGRWGTMVRACSTTSVSFIQCWFLITYQFALLVDELEVYRSPYFDDSHLTKPDDHQDYSSRGPLALLLLQVDGEVLLSGWSVVFSPLQNIMTDFSLTFFSLMHPTRSFFLEFFLMSLKFSLLIVHDLLRCH